MRIMHSTLCVTLLAAGLASPAAARNPHGAAAPAGVADLDARWLPWMGCWQLAEERIGGTESPDPLPEPMEVCIAPAEEGRGAALTANGGGEALLQRALIADGARRDVTEGDCGGWERREWSADGRRLFTRAEIRCGTEPPRRMSGVSLLVNRSTWVDVQGVSIDDRRHVEIRRYRPAPAADALQARLPAAPRELREARQAAAGPLTLAGVREAAARADSHVVEALLTESQPKLPLDADTLIELDDAGVDGGVIDLLVALAYPERFVVERRASGGGGGWGTGWGGFGGAYAPIHYSRAMYGTYAPWGYGGYWYDPYWGSYGYRPGVGGPGGVVRGDGLEASRVRAIDGRGFTRVQPRTAVPRRNPDGGSGGGGSGGARPRSGGSSSPSSGGWSGGGGGRSGGGATRVTSGGFTRSGGGGGSSGGGGGSSSSSSSSGGGGGGRAVPRQP